LVKYGVRKIVYYPDPILRVKTPKIVGVDKQLLADVEDLREVLVGEREHAAGLAAVQIGLKRRFFGLIMGQKRELQIFINPTVTKTYGEKTRPVMVYDDGKRDAFLEGCLSFPALFGTVKRYLKIEVGWEELINEKLETRNEKLEGIEAIAFQHELDHLEGILFIDHIKEEGGEIFNWGGEKKVRLEIDSIVEKEK
jgi:peptide deformylase